ncbi:uncharacterized protein LOC107011973 [Solanum pennellii]|uniref:Uncharacterized protein LOC107011973 n=1 Tax=Solanum pennellii TaxID=28526 RepID=A0ABM1G7S1_SOLPN|nr:uncharacterized protein LOC107011973 [Solanum pennellii]
MEDTTWNQRIQALTHIILNPTTKPSFESQIFISNQIPCYLNWDYPPILCTKITFPSVYLKWAFSYYLKWISRLGAPETSWRSKCPYQQPPPLILAKGVEEAQWGDEERRQFVRKRFKKRIFSREGNIFVLAILPNILALLFIFRNPYLKFMK